jgi:hypothetical protein
MESGRSMADTKKPKESKKHNPGMGGGIGNEDKADG